MNITVYPQNDITKPLQVCIKLFTGCYISNAKVRGVQYLTR